MQLCQAWDAGEVSDEVLADKVGNLITSRDGARGFFVITLSVDCPLLDRLPDPLMIKLRSGGEKIVDLTVRNLAMSSAMALQHERESNHQLQATSERISIRCLEILRFLEPRLVKIRLEKMLCGLKGTGEDVAFLKRWGYDKEQKKAIALSINSVAES